MALLDPIATVAQYQARSSSGNAVGDSATLLIELTANTRLLERELGVPPGGWTSAAGQTLYLDGHGGDLLRFRDELERQWLVQSIDADGIGIDTERDGTFDGISLDLADAWVVGWPANAAAVGEPYLGLRLLTDLSSCNPAAWPSRRRSVRLACTTGYAEVPPILTEVVVSMTRDLRDHHQGGAAAQYQQVDQSMPLAPDTWRLIASAKRHYSHRLPAVA